MDIQTEGFILTDVNLLKFLQLLLQKFTNKLTILRKKREATNDTIMKEELTVQMQQLCIVSKIRGHFNTKRSAEQS